MQVANSLVADVDRLRDMMTGAQVLDYLEDRLRSLGATRFLATGLPLPGRPLAPLILRASWGDYRGDRPGSLAISQTDPVLQMALRARLPFEWPALDDNAAGSDSSLVALAGPPGEVKLIAVPVAAFPPYQACVVGGGAGFALDAWALLALGHFCSEAFARLLELNFIRRERPGDLSARERRVVELSALGKTAGEIADVLKISQRTVHAHLQNASEKLRASNKTHTVVEALRYGQIEI
jgi:LuxR family quorum sensing-dependent transcriptional regulator